MKKKSAHTIPSTRILSVSIIIVFFLVYLALSIYFKVFVVQHIECAFEGEKCSEPVIAELSHLRDSFFFSSNIETTVSKIIHSDPYISEIEVNRQFPHSVFFLVKKKSSLAEIKCESSDLLVNTEGKVEENTRNLRLKIDVISANQLVCDRLISQGSIDMNTLHALMGFTKTIAKDDTELQVEWTDQATVVVQTPSHQKIILPLDQLDHTFDMYRYLLDQNQLKDGWVELDLRFQKAIVKTQ